MTDTFLKVFTVISVLIFNPYAAAMVMVIVIVITVELGGFMGLFGVKVSLSLLYRDNLSLSTERE